MLKKIVVGISGGVDSAVAALFLRNKGFNVTGVFMKNWDIKDETGVCQVEEDYEHAQWLCDKIKIPLVEANFVKEYWNHIFCYLTEQYENGRTPNPDVLCNKLIKFDHFYKFARTELRADAIATGHYVRTSFGPYLERFVPNADVKLYRARDKKKDQTLFLSQVPQEALRSSMFPLGDYLKTDVKQIAREAGLDVIVRKKESYGICFVGKRNFPSFISEYIPEKPGELVDLDDGRVVGNHSGFHHWTVGQRLKLPNHQFRYFVYKKDAETNNIIVVRGTNHPALYTDFLITEPPHWISSEPKEFTSFGRMLNCHFRFQHKDSLVPCIVHKDSKNQLLIRINQPLRAITNGQFAVLYNDEECLGSAAITYCGPSYFSLGRELRSEDQNQKLDEGQKQTADRTIC